MKRLSKILITLIATILCCSFLFGCTIEVTDNGIVSIEKTATEGLVDTYTITFSDGSKTTFEVTNGKDGQNGINGDDGVDGKDGLDLTIDDVFNKYLETHPNATYEEFLKDVLSINNNGNSAVINRVLNSSLKVYTEFTVTSKTMYGQTNKKSVSAGSAVVYKVDSDYTYIITNYHVVYNASQNTDSKIAKKIICYLYGSESSPYDTGTKDSSGYAIYDYGKMAIECEYVGGSIGADLAIIKTPTSTIKGINENVKAVEFASGYYVGETAIAIGNPEDEGISVTEGVVSVDNEYIALSLDGTSRKYRSIRIDTALYHGNSGGGLFNSDGKLIGITNAGDQEDQNVNYAIPIEIVESVVSSIMKYNDGYAHKITLGVTVTADSSKYVYDEKLGYGKIEETIKVSEVNENSIASAMGLKANDLLKSFKVNDVSYTLSRNYEIGDLLFKVKEGDKISFTYLRDNKEENSSEYTVLSQDVKKVD